MKKKILLFAAIVAMLVCLFAISASAATTETIDGVTYSLNNGTASVTNANKSCALETVIIPETVVGADGKEYTVKEINQEAFLGNKNIKYVSLPATITKLGPSAFRECSNLNFVDFNDNQNDVDFNNWGHFKDCTSLKAVSMPDNVDLITNRIFANCKNLEAVYLPSATTNIETNGYGDNGAFSYCHKMYFVQEPFEVRDENGNFYGDKFVMPERPDVYFFPSNLEKLYKRDSGVGFFQCYELNPVMVMPETLTQLWVNDGVFYECGKTGNQFTVVLLGNMTDVRIGLRDSRAKGVSYVFANPADKTLNDVNIVNSNTGYNPSLDGSEHIYFCHSDKYFKIFKADSFTESNVEYITGVPHVANPLKTETTPADCVNDRAETTYCFCKAKIGSNPVEGTALGHEYDLAKGAVKSSVEYANYLANGILKIKCARCTECQENKVNPIITEFKGFSVSEKGDGITFGYSFDKAAISEFEAVNGKIELGFVVAVKAFAGNDAYTSDKAIKAAVTDEKAQYTGADFILRGTWDKMVDLDGDGTEETNVKNVEFYMAGYILVNGAVTYLNYGASGATADTVTFNTCNKQETPEIVE